MYMYNNYIRELHSVRYHITEVILLHEHSCGAKKWRGEGVWGEGEDDYICETQPRKGKTSVIAIVSQPVCH